jgi:hypothetical protein
MADIATDPLTAVHEELWLLLEDSPDFTHRMKDGNKITYVGNRDPEKQEISTEDLPEVRIVPGGLLPHLQWTSNSSRLTARYSIEVRSGSKDLSEAHYPLVWAVYKAMRPWADRLRELTIAENDHGPFVMLGRPSGDVTEGIERGEVTRGVEGWFSIWVVEVDMQFASSALS